MYPIAIQWLMWQVLSRTVAAPADDCALGGRPGTAHWKDHNQDGRNRSIRLSNYLLKTFKYIRKSRVSRNWCELMYSTTSTTWASHSQSFCNFSQWSWKYVAFWTICAICSLSRANLGLEVCVPCLTWTMPSQGVMLPTQWPALQANAVATSPGAINGKDQFLHSEPALEQAESTKPVASSPSERWSIAFQGLPVSHLGPASRKIYPQGSCACVASFPKMWEAAWWSFP